MDCAWILFLFLPQLALDHGLYHSNRKKIKTAGSDFLYLDRLGKGKKPVIFFFIYNYSKKNEVKCIKDSNIKTLPNLFATLFCQKLEPDSMSVTFFLFLNCFY